MRRAFLVLALVGGLAYSVSGSLAAPAVAGSALVPHRSSLHAWVAGGLTHADRQTHITARRAGNQTASQLALPASAFSPATINTNYGGALTVSDANNNWFRANHSRAYDTFGYVAAYYQRADWSVTNPPISFRYQGTALTDATQAANLWNDGVTYTQKQAGVTSTNCSNDTSVVKCAYLDYGVTDANNANWAEEYDVIQYQNCVAEMTVDIPVSAVTQYGTQATQIQDNINKAAAALLESVCNAVTAGSPTATPAANSTATSIVRPTATATSQPLPQTAFYITSVRFEKNGAKADWQLKKKPLSSAKVGARVNLSAYFSVSAVPSGSRGSAEFLLTHSGKTIISKKYAESVPQPDTYRTYLKNVVLPTAGTYKLTIRITVNGVTDAGTASLKAGKKSKSKKK